VDIKIRNARDRPVGSVAAGIAALGVFWVFGATMAALAGGTLTWPGTTLDRMWVLNRPAYESLAPLGHLVGPLFLLLSGLLLVTAVAWFRRSRWGWRLGVAILSVQVTGDAVNLVRGDYLRGVTGVVIASGLLVFLCQRRVREEFP